jgi:uncharacterized OB-fold protein
MANQVYAAKCKSCGALSYPTHFYCPTCGEVEFDPVPIEGEGTLITWTRAHALPIDYAQRFLTLGIVQLDMGVNATGQLEIDEPRTGMRVCARVGKVRETLGDDIQGLVFRAV